METYINSFIRGRELLKKLLVGDMASAVLAIVFKSNPMVMGVFSIATIILFIAIIYIAAKYCRCPNCGKVIVVGVPRRRRLPPLPPQPRHREEDEEAVRTRGCVRSRIVGADALIGPPTLYRVRGFGSIRGSTPTAENATLP